MLASLAYIRDGTLHSPSSSSAAAAPQPTHKALPPPAGALLISPAADFTSSSVFGRSLRNYFGALQSSQQRSKQRDVQSSELPPARQPAGSEWDYITVAEGPAVAKLYVLAQSEDDMAQPLISPIRLESFKGLVQQKVLLVWGAVEVMAHDIAALAGRMRGDGVDVQVHAEPNEAHVYPVLPFEGVRQRGAKLIVPFLASCALNKA